MSNIKNGLILAAGQGKRLGATSSQVKAFVEVNGRPIICNIIDYFLNFGIENIYIVKYVYDDFSKLQREYGTKCNIIFIDDYKRKGSLWSFFQAREIVKVPFVSADCDIVAENKSMQKMLADGEKMILQGGYDGMAAMVLKPSKFDIDMLIVKENRAIGFEKLGSKEAVRGGYIYIWNLKSIFDEAVQFLKIQNYSYSKYLNYLMKKYKVGLMKIDDLWDIDTYEDIKFTQDRFK